MFEEPISLITAVFEEDKKDLVGILRITEVDLESDVPDSAISDAKDELFNVMSDK